MRMMREARRAASSAGSTAEREILERRLVAKKERFVGGHGLDDRRHQGVVIAAVERSHELAEIAETGLARNRQQPALDQILLVGR